MVMNKTMKISVIIPVYKVEKYIDQCIESVINQTYDNLEIILIDDGSPDKCPQICDEYASKDERIIVIHKKNGGLASARNIGLDAATGDLISFVDSDDWIDKEMYYKMVQLKEKHKSSIVCCEGIHTDGKVFFEECFSCKTTGTILSGKEATKEILLDKVGSQAVKGLYDKMCWDNVRFPVGMLYEDIPTTFRAFEKASSIVYLDEPFYKYRINPKSISGSPNPLKPYHEYLGFKSHYDHAKINFPDISSECCTKTALFGISTLLHSYTDAREELSNYSNEIKEFLNCHKSEVNYDLMPKSRVSALKVYYFSEHLFSVMAKIFYKSGLQKRMGFDVK